MKDFFKILIFSLFAITTYAQQATEIDSKFLKLPRYENLTAIDLAIPSPSQGMMVYNIDTKTNWYFNGTDWMNTHGAVSAPLNLTRTTSGQIGDCTICGERITNGDPMNPDVQGGIGVKGTASGGQTSNILAGSGVYGIGLGYNNGVLGYSDNSYGVYGNSSSGVGGYFSGNFALETSGVIKFGGSGVGTPAAGKVLTSTDNSGFAAWQDLLPLFRTLDDPGNLLNLTNTGLGGSGYFRINNSLNNDNAVEGRILGGGSAFYGIAEGTEGYAARFESYNYFPTFKSTNYENGNAGRFEINNTNSIVEALNVNSNGLGRSGWFQSTNPLNNAATLIAENNGTGQGIYGTNFGTGKAGVFEINNSSNTNIAIHALTNGTGKAAYFQGINALETNGTLKFGGSGVGLIEAGRILTSDAVGNATWQAIPAVVAPLNLTHTSTTFQSTSTGTTGSAGSFSNSNVINTETALAVYTNGTGSAFDARTYGPGNAIRASTNTGSAGYFEISSAANINDALGITTIGNGTALNAFTSGSGNAIRGTTSGTGKAAYFQGTNALETNGIIKFGGSGVGTIAAGKVLTSDAVGNATWQVIPSVAAPLNLTHTATTLQSVASGVSGFAGDFQITNVSNNTAAFRAFTNGTAGAGIFSIANVSNTQNVLHASTNGTGKAAFLQGTNALETDGTIKFGGSGVGTIAAGKVLTSDAVGNATWQVIPAVAGPLNLTSTTTTFSSSATGTSGNAGNFSITNASNASNGISVSTSGTGKAIDAANNSSTNPTINIVNNTNLGNAIDITGGIKVSGTNKAAFKITSITGGGGNTSLNILTIPNTTLANNANDILIVTHNYSPNNTYLNKAYGVYWTGTSWAIYLEDIASAMPNNITFNVLVIKQ